MTTRLVLAIVVALCLLPTVGADPERTVIAPPAPVAHTEPGSGDYPCIIVDPYPPPPDFVYVEHCWTFP